MSYGLSVAAVVRATVIGISARFCPESSIGASRSSSRSSQALAISTLFQSLCYRTCAWDNQTETKRHLVIRYPSSGQL